MKNKKIMIVFIMIIAVLMLFTLSVSSVKAFDDADFIIDENTEKEKNNETNNVGNNEISNNEETNNQANTNNENNSLKDTSAENKLPQTGVAESTTLFVFITVCIASAIYAYIKIRKYKSI